MCACLQLWANTSYPALWLIRTKGTSCFKSLTSQQHWPDWLGLQSTDLFPPLVAVLRVCSGALLASNGLSTSLTDEWHQAGEDRCVAKRLPGILFLPNWSVWCQEDHPSAGTFLDFIGKVGGSCEQMSVSYKNSNEALELNVGSRLSGRVHLPKLVKGVPSRHSGVHWGKGCINWQHIAWHSIEWQVWWYYLRPLRHPKKWHWEWAAVPGCLSSCLGPHGVYIYSIMEGKGISTRFASSC